MATGTMTLVSAGASAATRNGLSESIPLAGLLQAASIDLSSETMVPGQPVPPASVMSDPPVTLTGGGGYDILVGGSGNDWLDGGGGYDELYGADGDDTLIGGEGDDFVFGGTGNNVMIAGGGTDSFDGNGGFSTVDYTDFAYAMEFSLTVSISAGEHFGFGVWRISGLFAGGHIYNTISGIKGTGFADFFDLEYKWALLSGNIYDGGAGNDTFSFQFYPEGVSLNLLTNEGPSGINVFSFEQIIGSAFNDTLIGSSGNDTLTGGSGNDRLDGSDGDDYLYGSAGNDTILASTGWNEIYGGEGDDLFLLGSHFGNNQYRGGDGFDTADYSDFTGDIVLVPYHTGFQIGKSKSYGWGTLTHYDYLIDAEHVRGTNSDDYFYFGSDGGPAGMTVDGSGGADTLSFLYSDVGVTLNLSSRILSSGAVYSSIEKIEGSGYNDTITGSTRSDYIDGMAGTDTFFADRGRDTLFGGSGSDTLSYASSGGVRIDLQSGGAQKGGFALGDVISGFETIIGSAAGPNWFRGDSGNNVFEGGSASDMVLGSAGSDEYFGGSAVDTVDYRDFGKQNSKRVFVQNDMSVVKTGPSESVTSGQPTDTLHSMERFFLTQFGDTFEGLEDQSSYVSGEGGDDTLYSIGLDDTILGGAGNDTIDWGCWDETVSPVLAGSSGWDTLSLHLMTSGVTVTATSASVAGSTARISGFECYVGSIYNDTISGGLGAETIDGSFGDDVLRGGGGRDTFLLNMGDDRILDFRIGFDKLATEMDPSVVFTVAVSGADKVISWGSDSVTLVGLAKKAFTADDILHI